MHTKTSVGIMERKQVTQGRYDNEAAADAKHAGQQTDKKSRQ
ncbi:MAG: hypothetical protein V3S70_03270 [Gammaproteobacteria bacterium]